MKISRWAYIVFALLLVSVCALSFGLFLNPISQAQTTKAPNSKSEMTWKHEKHIIKSKDSQFSVELPTTLADNSDWAIGVIPAKTDEEESVLVGVISWQDTGANKARKVEKISEIVDYPTEAIDISDGTLKLKNVDNLKLAGKTLVVFLKAKSNTNLSLTKNNETVLNKKIQDNFAAQNGVQVPVTGSSVSALLTQLQTNRLMSAFGVN